MKIWVYGLFGTLSRYGTIKNIKLRNSYIKGLSGVGGIVGTGPLTEYCGDIDNCSIEGAIVGDSYIGGIIGCFANKISNCTNYANIYSEKFDSLGNNNSYIGGIVGFRAIEINNCHNEGNIISFADSVGGIVGFGCGYLNNLVNLGNITGISNIGGILGDGFRRI